MKSPPPPYREPSPLPVRQQRHRKMLLRCLPLSGLLLALFACGAFGLITSLVWLTTPPENGRVTRIGLIQPLQVGTPTPPGIAVEIAPIEKAAESITPASPPPPPSAIPDPVLAAPIAPLTTLDDNPAPAAPVATTATPTPPPSSIASSIVTSNDGGPAEPTATITLAPIPEWWQNYMNRVQEQESTN